MKKNRRLSGSIAAGFAYSRHGYGSLTDENRSSGYGYGSLAQLPELHGRNMNVVPVPVPAPESCYLGHTRLGYCITGVENLQKLWVRV